MQKPTPTPELGSTPAPPRYRFLETHPDVVEMIMTMRKDGKTLQQVANVLHLTRERIRQIEVMIIAVHGRESVRPIRLWSVTEAAHIFSFPSKHVSIWCRDGSIPTCPRERVAASYLITQEGMTALKKKIREFRRQKQQKKYCGNCRTVVTKPLARGKYFCSVECQRQRVRKNHCDIIRKRPTQKNVHGWHRELLTALRQKRRPARDIWLPLSEAVELTGLSKTQLSWLARRKILVVRPHPHVTMHGQPIRRYSRTQLLIVQQIYERFRPQQAA